MLIDMNCLYCILRFLVVVIYENVYSSQRQNTQKTSSLQKGRYKNTQYAAKEKEIKLVIYTVSKKRK